MKGVLADVLNVQVGKPTLETSTVACGADTAGSLAGDSWKFTVLNSAGTALGYQVYYIVNSVGVDPTIGVAEIDAITNRADVGGNMASKYFTINNGISTAETAYYVYFHIADVAGYQEYGLTGKSGATDTGLVAETIYYFKVTIDGGDQTEYSITTPTGTITFTILMALLNATGAGLSSTWSIVGGDLRCTSKSLVPGSAIALAAGTTGTDLAGALTDFTAYDTAVARVTSYDPKLGQFEVTNITLRADASGDLDGDYWTLMSGAGAAYYVWYAVAGETNTDPAPGGTGIRVDIVNGETVLNVCAKTAAAINAQQTAIFSVAKLGSTKIRLTNLQCGAATDAADGTCTGLTFAVVQVGVAVVSALATKTLLCKPVVTVAAADETVAAALAAALVAVGWTAVPRAPANDHIVDVTHPTRGNCTNSADGNVGGAFAIGITTGVDPTTASFTSIPVSIATGTTAENVAIATKAAIEAVSKMDQRLLITRSTATLTLTNLRGGVCADTADVNTGWTIATTLQGSATVTYNMGQDVATANYWYRPAENKVARIRRLLISLSDTAVTGGTLFGALTALTNGCNINICATDGTVIKTLFGPIKTNADLLSLDVGSPLGTTYLFIYLDIEAAWGEMLSVIGSAGQYIEMDVNDNLVGIDGFYMTVSGYLEDSLS